MLIAASMLAVLAFARAQAEPPRANEPSAKEIDEGVARLFELDARTAEGAAEERRIVERLELVSLDAAQEKSWRTKLAKLAAKSGPELEKDSGKHFFWPEDKKGTRGRGLYIVGGETKKPKGLLIGMHGGGAGSGDAWTAHGSLDPAARKLDWLAIYPEVLEKTERGWTDSGTEEFVLDLIEGALRTWKIDRDRVFLSGHSMGGYGTWTLGARHADLVAGLAPSAGAPTTIIGPGGVANDIDWGIAPNLRNVPIRIYQSDDDKNVPPDANRLAVKKLEESRERFGGFDFEYWEAPNRGHDLPPGGMIALLEKLADVRRDARPDKVVWQPVLAWKRRFYWLWWDEPRKGAIVEAQLDAEKNSVDVKCDQDAKGLSVLLDDELVDLDRELVVTLNGAEVFRGLAQRDLGVLARTAASRDPALTFSARIALVR